MVPASRSLVDVLIPSRQAVNMATLPGPSDDYWYEDRPLTTTAGQPVTGRTALTLSGCWAATNAIAGLFGALPCKTYQKLDEKRREERPNHPSSKLVGEEPNPDMDSFVFWEMMTQWWVNYGNAFAEIQRLEQSDGLFALWPIHPSRVRPERDVAKNWTGRWLVRSNGDVFAPLEARDVFNIVGHLSDDGLIGKGVITYAARAIGVGLAQAQYEGDFYGNGGRPSGTLEHPGKLEPKARDNLRREWRTVHGKSNEVAVLWEGMKFNPLSVDPEHAKLIDSRVFTVQEMCRFYDLPPHVLYELSKGTFANTEEMNRFLMSQPFNKRVVRVEKALRRQLLSESEKRARYYYKFNVSALLRGNPKEQAEINQIKIQNGVINQDEWRSQDELNELPDGQGKHYWMRRDMATTELILKSNGALPGSQDIGPTPPKPGTPPTPDDGQDDATDQFEQEKAELQAKIDKLTNKVEAADKLAEEAACEMRVALEGAGRAAARVNEVETSNATLQQSVEAVTGERDQLQQAIGELTTEKTGLQQAIEVGNSQFAAVSQRLEESQNALVAAHAERDQVRGIADEHASKIGTLESQLAAASNQLATTTTTLAELQNSAQQAETARQKAENGLAEAMQHLKALETRSQTELTRVKNQADQLLGRVEAMSVELGTARSERDTTHTTNQVLEKAREELLIAVTEHKNAAKLARDEANRAKADAAAAKNAQHERIAAGRLELAAAVRGMLAVAIDKLIADEQHEARVASRRPDQFKQVMNGYYLQMSEALQAQLTHAACALELAGFARVDVARIVSHYVADGRTRLNNVFHKTPANDLRSAVRQETENWEDRRAPLTNWIGD